MANEKLFNAIVESYRGKVVLVDFWATWCGPCRTLINRTEPLKDNILKLDDLVFVYFTNFSSPEGKWLSMLAGIRGEHYRVDEQQWRYICEKFEIDGIPSYVLVDRSGSYELRNDLRNHEKMKRTLLQKVSAH